MNFSKFSANDFLDPNKFKTSMDYSNSNQYAKGLDISNNAVSIGVSVHDTWWACMKDGSRMTSYEKLGYHSNTCALLSGFLAGSASFQVYRMTDKGVVTSIIK